MKVSVVIPSYNNADLVGEAVNSVLAQTVPAHEILVIDDGSQDDTAGRMAAFGAPVRYIRKENGGVSTARNRGVAEATGDWIAFLDADDVWHPSKLERQIAALKANPDIAMIGSRVYDWPGTTPDLVEKLELLHVTHDELIIANCMVTSTILVQRDVMQEVGPFDLNLRGPEDHDMWIRIAANHVVVKMNIALTGYRHSTPNSLSKNARQMEEGMAAILRKLDSQGVFRNRPLFRRRAWALYRYSWGFMHHQAGNKWRAVGHLARSLITYPLPYDRDKVRYSFGRLRLLVAALLKSQRGAKVES